MIYSKEVEMMCPVAKGAKHEPAPIPEEGKWVHSKKIVTAGLVVGITIVGWDISRYPTLSVLVTRNVNESQMKDPSSMIFS